MSHERRPIVERAAAQGITAVEGLELGHCTLADRPTGCTVILARGGAVAGVDVRGGAPGSREFALLDPVHTVQAIHAVVLAGGSAYGLDAASGVMRYLEEREIGYRVSGKVVPIVVSAILFDLHLEGNSSSRPGPECGYRAAESASRAAHAEGSVGAGAGATVGKLRGPRSAMRGGFGTASATFPSGLTVAAAVVVNAVGDVVDPATGRVIAGVRDLDGHSLLDARRLILSEDPAADANDPSAPNPSPISNTTLGVVATNAILTKPQATKLAQMAQDGMARAIHPVHTPHDGDTIFGLATGRCGTSFDATRIGALGADLMTEAILRAVRAADPLPDLPSARDLELGRL